ncbi:MAG: hypothetical protein ACI9V1_002797 [Spirosomataceae bacterium]|jgi:hypothetical protein
MALAFKTSFPAGEGPDWAGVPVVFSLGWD